MYKFIIPLFALAFLLVSCGKQPDSQTPPVNQNTQTSTPTGAIADEKLAFDGVTLSGMYTVVLHTSKGDVTLELNADAAPKSVTNFVTLAKNGYYDNLSFHRVIPGFMIQGGDPSGDGTGGKSVFGDTFEDEINANTYGLATISLKDAAGGQELPPEIANLNVKQFYEQSGYIYNDKLQSLPMEKGSIAMANRGPNTNGSQFFILTADKTPWLEGKHTIFGRVTKGMDVVEAIANAERDASDKPTAAITFTAEVIK